VVDTSETLDGAPFTMAQAILHDPDCASADGGLVKRGAGLLTLTGANTYTGPTVVEEGVLVVSGTGTLGAGGGLAVARGAICDLGGTAQAVGDVTASGLVRNGALTVGGALVATGTDLLTVDGNFALANTAAVDFAAVSDADLAAGVPLAAVFGTATLPARARALNAGSVHGVVFKQADNVIYAVPAPNGAVLVIR
jgi:autotransporter-associated beta strand protein